jgi:hypothetical protein
MKIKSALLSLITISLAFCFGFASCDNAPQTSGSRSATSNASPAPSSTDTAKQGDTAKQQARPDIERQRQDAEQKAEKTLDKDAVAAIAETQNAVKAITQNKNDEALAALERATGKINILLARNPKSALIPVAYSVDSIEAAPLEIDDIKERAKAAQRVVLERDFPAARAILDGLTSEVRSRTYNLPLATYPDAMKDAARFLDQKKTKEAIDVLSTALNTLVVVDRVRPIPLILAQVNIDEAQSLREKDKNGAQKFLAEARRELDRAVELGYAGGDPQYYALNKSISNLETQLKGNEDTTSAFSKLKDEVAGFFKRVSESVRKG